MRSQESIRGFLGKQGLVMTIPGLFTTHIVGSQVYCEVPDSLFGRDIMITHTLLAAPALKQRNPDKKTGYAGDLFGPIVVRLRSEDGQIKVYKPLYDRLLPTSTLEIREIASQRGDETLIGSIIPKMVEHGRYLIEATPLFSLSPCLNLGSLSIELGLSPFPDVSLKDVKADAGSVIFKTIQSYMSAPQGGSGIHEEPYLKTFKVGTCITLAPDVPLEPIKLVQPNYFYVSKVDFDTDPYKATKSYFIKRWRLLPSFADRERYDRGEVVPPVAPIVFYIDSLLPKKWMPYVIDAVEVWRSAFERAGFKDAIHARPITKEDPFDPADSRHPYISWKTSPQRNAYGPHPNDPRTGEIMASHVGIFSSVLDMLRDWYFVQCGAMDPVARQIELPDSVMGELIKMVVTHEVGHTLGLEHNFFGSNMASIDQLRDDAYLSEHGFTSSVMDYVRCNYALRPGDQVSLRNRISRIGAYDRHIIAYGYKIFSGKDADERATKREAWLAANGQVPEHRFVGGKDARALAEDLGKDQIAVNTQGMENVKYLSSLSELWQPWDVLSQRVMQRRVKAMTEAFVQWTGHATDQIGGRVEGGPASSDRVDAAVRFLKTFVLTPPTWLLDQARFERLDLDVQIHAEEMYQKIMPMIVRRIENLAVLHENGYRGILPLRSYLEGISGMLFSDMMSSVDATEDYLRTQSIMRRCYVVALGQLLKTTKSSSVRLEVWKEICRLRQESVKASDDSPKVIISEIDTMI